MTEVQIDRLIVQVPGLSVADGRNLAQQVAEGLGRLSGGLNVAALRLDLRVSAILGVDELAKHILAELLRAVRRLP